MHYVVYASKRPETTSDIDVDNIIRLAEKYNTLSDITGILLVKNGYFLQYLEGNKNPVTNLLEKLKSDVRHNDLLILSEGEIQERVFPEWRMAPIHHTTDHSAFSARINNTQQLKLKHTLNKYFIQESPISFAYSEKMFS